MIRDKITEKEYEEISELVQNAISANNKREAKPFIDKLEFLGKDLIASTRIMYSELVAATISASGRIANKEFYVNDANMLLIKLKLFCVE